MFVATTLSPKFMSTPGQRFEPPSEPPSEPPTEPPVITGEFPPALDPDSYEVEEMEFERRINKDGKFVEIVDGKEVVIERRKER